MSRELMFPTPSIAADPAVFELVKAKFTKPNPGKVILSPADLITDPIAQYIKPVIAEIPQGNRGKPALTTIECWQQRGQPGQPFMSPSTRKWHLDGDELFIADTQGPEFLSGSSDNPDLTEDISGPELTWRLNQLSDEELLDTGFTIQQARPYAAMLSSGDTYHRTAINNTATEVTRHLIAATLSYT